ncbi:hypothetical protein V5799_015230 [Amblyomma americanum]|uniref:Uncharacterized protein n=1 Tax=Amblyomma americanum TaxID=6943 RepID=A0AAQ4E0R3_AMBAM
MAADWSSWMSSVMVRERTEPFYKRGRRHPTRENSSGCERNVFRSFAPRCTARNAEKVVAKLACENVDELVFKFMVAHCTASAFQLYEEIPSLGDRHAPSVALRGNYVKPVSAEPWDILPPRQDTSAKCGKHVGTPASVCVDSAEWYDYLKGDIVNAEYLCAEEREQLEVLNMLSMNFVPHELSPEMEAGVDAALEPHLPEEVHRPPGQRLQPSHQTCRLVHVKRGTVAK